MIYHLFLNTMIAMPDYTYFRQNLMNSIATKSSDIGKEIHSNQNAFRIVHLERRKMKKKIADMSSQYESNDKAKNDYKA